MSRGLVLALHWECRGMLDPVDGWSKGNIGPMPNLSTSPSAPVAPGGLPGGRSPPFTHAFT